MKRKISLILAAAMSAAILSGVFAAEITYDTGITVTVDGNAVEFDQQPVIADDRTLVPVRAIFEALGAEVEWVAESRTVVSTKDDKVCELVIDSNEMKVGDASVMLDVPAMIINDRTLVPVRAISEAYGCEVEWIADTKTVVISSAITTTVTPEATAEPEATVTPEATAVPTATPAPTATPTPEPITTAFADKKLCLFGDDTVAHAKDWMAAVKLAIGPAEFTSVNAGRLSMIINSGTDMAANQYLEKIPSDADYVLVQSGLAEWTWNWYGENGTNTMNSLEEGLENLYYNLKVYAPRAEIIFVTQPFMTVRSEYMDADGVTNKNGLSPEEMARVTKMFADSVGCEVIDIYNETGWNIDNYRTYMKNTSDNYLYPNAEGSKVIAEIITKRLMEINPEDSIDE